MSLQLKDLKLHASRWTKILQENEISDKCTKILRKRNKKIQDDLHVMCDLKDWFCGIHDLKDWFCSIHHCVTNTVRAFFAIAYFVLFRVIYLRGLQCVKYILWKNTFLVNVHFTILYICTFKYIFKIFMKD
jgi:hypothetical protein